MAKKLPNKLPTTLPAKTVPPKTATKAVPNKTIVTEETVLGPGGLLKNALEAGNNSGGSTYQALLDAQNQKMSGLESQLNSLTSQLNQQSDIKAQIEALNQAKQAQAITDLGKARDTQLSNLALEESGIKPMYDTKRNSAAATNMIGRRTLAEELAARGESKSGVADQANINANMSLQSDTGTLNAQEASNLSDIARQRTGVQNTYESDVVSAKAGLEAAAMQNLINQYNADKQYKLQEAGVTGTYNGNQTLDALNSAKNFALNEANVTGKYNGNQTLEAQNQLFNQDITTKQYNNDVKQQKLDNLYRQQTFDYQKSRDTVSDSQWQQQMNLDLRQESLTEAQQKIENALSSKRISQDDASQALQWAKFNAEQDPNSLDNQYKKAQIDASNNKTNTNTTSTVDDYASVINSQYLVKPSAANKYQSSMNKVGIKSYIDKLIMAGVDESITDSLAARYGIN